MELEQVLITSTSETYGIAQYVPIYENHSLTIHSHYSASKIAADQLAFSYEKSFDLAVLIVRPFNTYGPRKSARAVILTIITQGLSGSHELKLGNLAPTRDLTFMKDTCSAFFEIFHSDSFFGQVTNIVMNKENSIEDLTHEIMRLMEINCTIPTDKHRNRTEISGVDRLVCNITKLTSNYNWKTRYNLQQGLKETIQWFCGNANSYKSEQYLV